MSTCFPTVHCYSFNLIRSQNDEIIGQSEKILVNCKYYLNTFTYIGTGYWHFKVEYKDEEHEECQVTRIGGLS